MKLGGRLRAGARFCQPRACARPWGRRLRHTADDQSAALATPRPCRGRAGSGRGAGRGDGAPRALVCILGFPRGRRLRGCCRRPPSLVAIFPPVGACVTTPSCGPLSRDHGPGRGLQAGPCPTPTGGPWELTPVVLFQKSKIGGALKGL